MATTATTAAPPTSAMSNYLGGGLRVQEQQGDGGMVLQMEDNAREPQTSVATAQLTFLSENGYCVPNKIPKILKIFKGVEGAKGQGECFGTKELDHPFLCYSDGFDLAHGLAPNQSHVNNPGMNNPIP